MAAIGRTQFPKVRLLGVGWLAGLALICAASTLPAQGVTPLNPTTMQFTDPAHGVSFTYPASWTLDKDQKNQPFFMSLAITPADDAPATEGLSALIYTKSIPGMTLAPDTMFDGMEFAYDVHNVPTSDACLVLAKPANLQVPIDHVDEITIQGNHYWHARTSSNFVGDGLNDDIYTFYSSGYCYRFDLAVSLSSANQDTPGPRKLTPAEKVHVDASLQSIFNSLRIVPPAQ